MNEAVDRVLEDREAMDRGFPLGIVLSGAVHLLLVGSAFAASWLGLVVPRSRWRPVSPRKYPVEAVARLRPIPRRRLRRP
jgi:hypothetical protein